MRGPLISWCLQCQLLSPPHHCPVCNCYPASRKVRAAASTALSLYHRAVKKLQPTEIQPQAACQGAGQSCWVVAPGLCVTYAMTPTLRAGSLIPLVSPQDSAFIPCSPRILLNPRARWDLLGKGSVTHLSLKDLRGNDISQCPQSQG